MSEATKAALDAAIAEHLADENPGAILTGYVCQAQYTTAEFMDDGFTGYLRLIQEGQGFTTTIGLTSYLKARTDHIAITDDDD